MLSQSQSGSQEDVGGWWQEDQFPVGQDRPTAGRVSTEVTSISRDTAQLIENMTSPKFHLSS